MNDLDWNCVDIEYEVKDECISTIYFFLKRKTNRFNKPRQQKVYRLSTYRVILNNQHANT